MKFLDSHLVHFGGDHWAEWLGTEWWEATFGSVFSGAGFLEDGELGE